MLRWELNHYIITDQFKKNRNIVALIRDHGFMITETVKDIGIHWCIGEHMGYNVKSIFYVFDLAMFITPYTSKYKRFNRYYMSEHIPDRLCLCDRKYRDIFLKEKRLDKLWQLTKKGDI